MRRIKTVMDLLLYKDWDGEHMNQGYSTIYGKVLYPVAINPFDFNRRRSYYEFNFGKNRYYMTR